MTDQLTPARTIFPPGKLLAEELAERGWNQTDFAEIIGRPVRLVNEIIAAKRGITATTALELSAALGTSAELWMGLESSYQLAKNQVRADEIFRKAALRSQWPVRDLQKRGWVVKEGSLEQIEESVFGFYGVTSAEDRVQYKCAARRSAYNVELNRVQEALLIRMTQLAKGVQAKPYSAEALRSRLPELKQFMEHPEEIRHVPRFLAECGVRFVICEPMTGSHLDGICTWLDANSPVIGMTLRLDRIDNFWFVLWHEITHVLNGDGKDGQPVIDENVDGDDGDDGTLPSREIAANQAAAEACVPQAQFQNWLDRVSVQVSRERVIGFAAAMHVHPGLVVGQLQRRLGRWDLFRQMLVKVRSHIVPSATTDGYGHVIA